jgi:hypothetical protein
MQWDLGLQGLALLGAISLGFGVFTGLVVGRGPAHRVVAAAITGVACFGVGLVTSEVFFGWATESELQPNVDGLSRDEALLSGVLTTAVVLLVLHYVPRRGDGRDARQVGRHRGQRQHV